MSIEKAKLTRREFLKIGAAATVAYILSALHHYLEYYFSPEYLIPRKLDYYKNTVIIGSSSIAAAAVLMEKSKQEFTEETIADHTHLFTKNTSGNHYLIDGWNGQYTSQMTNWFDVNPQLHEQPDHIVLALAFNDVFMNYQKPEQTVQTAKAVADYALRMKRDHPHAVVDLVYPFPVYAAENDEQRQARFAALDLFRETVREELLSEKNAEVKVRIKDSAPIVMKNGLVDPDAFKEENPVDKRHLTDPKETEFLRFLLL